MENKLMENWQQFSKNAMASAKELETINTEIVEKITAKQMELINAAFETSTRSVAALSEAKGYQELMSEQTKLAADFNEKLIEAARATADILTESREAYQGWMQKAFKDLPVTDFTVPGFPFETKTAAPKKAA